MVTRKSGSANRRIILFRLGVGGRWSPHDLECYLRSILATSGWHVVLRSQADINFQEVSAECSDSDVCRILEIVPLGDGLDLVSSCDESEELDAVLISPLADSSESKTEDQTRQVRRHLARFVRQLKPGGATIFAADDPASEIFSAIRLDCQRLGYAVSGAHGAFRIVRSDRPEPMHRSLLKYISPTDNADWPIVVESREQLGKALAALVTVNVLGVMPVAEAILNLSNFIGKPAISSPISV